MRRNKLDNATIPYLGGKRKLVSRISREFEGKVLLDVFSGSGIVSLKGKELGMRGISNDIATPCRIISEALIKNQSEKITDEDVYGLFLPSENNGFVEKNFSPKVFIPEVARNLDIFLANARKRTSPKRELLLLLIMKYILSLRQYGSFQVGRQDNEAILKGESKELMEIASESRGKKIRKNLQHPLSSLLELKNQINQGVFNNGKNNEVYQKDCFELLEMLRDSGEKIDTAYFDSPYYASTRYSYHYKVLNEILEGRLDVKVEDGAFNSKDVLENFRKMFELAQFIPKWVISMGHNPNSGIEGEKLLEVVKEFRDADLYYLQHNWAINNISSKTGKKQSENVEYLIVTK